MISSFCKIIKLADFYWIPFARTSLLLMFWRDFYPWGTYNLLSEERNTETCSSVGQNERRGKKLLKVFFECVFLREALLAFYSKFSFSQRAPYFFITCNTSCPGLDFPTDLPSTLVRGQSPYLPLCEPPGHRRDCSLLIANAKGIPYLNIWWIHRHAFSLSFSFLFAVMKKKTNWDT